MVFEESDFDKDMANTLASINEGSSPASPPAAPDATTASPPPASNAGAAPATPEPAAAPPEWESFPKQWKKDYEADWPKFDPRIKQYVHQREKESYDAFNRFKTEADQWAAAVKPFEAPFKQLGIDPRQMFGTVAQNHMLLKYGTPEQRRAVWDKLVNDYQLQEFFQGAQGQAPSLPPQYVARLDQLENTLRSRELAAAQTEVEKFFSNPENEFAKDVAGDMNRVLEAGLASDLGKAYEMAIRLNPAVHAKIVEREAEKIAGNRTPRLREVKSSATPPAPTTGTSGTIDETLAETYASIQQRS